MSANLTTGIVARRTSASPCCASSSPNCSRWRPAWLRSCAAARPNAPAARRPTAPSSTTWRGRPARRGLLRAGRRM